MAGGAVLVVQVLPTDALQALVKLKLHTKKCVMYGWTALHYACAAQRIGECGTGTLAAVIAWGLQWHVRLHLLAQARVCSAGKLAAAQQPPHVDVHCCGQL